MKAVVFLHMGKEIFTCLSLHDIIHFSVCCIFCDQLFIEREAVKTLMYQDARLQSLLPLFSLTFANESTFGVIRKLAHRISCGKNSSRVRVLSLKSTVTDVASNFLRANPDMCPAMWKDDVLPEGIVKASEDRIVLIARDRSLAEHARMPIIDPVLERTAVDEHNDFQPHRRNFKHSVRILWRGNSSSFCSSDEFEDDTHTALLGLGSLSDLELWSLEAMSLRASGAQSPNLSRAGSAPSSAPSPRRESISQRRDHQLNPTDIEDTRIEEEVCQYMRLDLNRLLPNQ